MKVISFSLWGSDLRYIEGAFANAKLAKQYYPDWELWLYCAENLPGYSQSLSGYPYSLLIDSGFNVICRPIQSSPWEGLFWRFEPACNCDVDIFISRDLDSRLNPREAAAVEEWIASGKTLHTMRDHYEHIVPILGGMWGLRRWPEFRTYIESWITRSNLGDDQAFLTNKIWPRLQGDCVAHDLYPVDSHIGTPRGPFTYKPVAFFGPHDIRPFPKHEPLQKEIHGEHVGSRLHV